MVRLLANYKDSEHSGSGQVWTLEESIMLGEYKSAEEKRSVSDCKWSLCVSASVYFCLFVTPIIIRRNSLCSGRFTAHLNH